MFFLTLRSLRFRAGAFTASLLAMFCGATILMAFGSLLDTGSRGGVDPASRETLFVMGGVVGGWGLLLVTFAVTSTTTLQVRQRAEEMALLRSVGATPAQLTRMIVAEAVVLALAAALLAIVPAVLAGRWLFARLVGNGQVAASVDHFFGGFAIHLGFGVTLAGAVAAALITARRTTRGRAAQSLLDAAEGVGRLGRARIAAACVFLFLGADLAVVTATVMRGKQDFEAMATAGPAAIWSSIGLALLAPALLRAVTGRLAGSLERRGAGGHLAALNLRGNSARLSPAVMPIILFTGIGTGTLYMQRTDSAAFAAAGLTKDAAYKNAEATNLIVIGMILLFAAIMVINTLVATTVHRRREFGGQRLIGATPGQVLRMVAAEGAVLTATGVLFGTLASLFTMVPFAVARRNSVVPDGGVLVYAGVVAVVAALTLLTTLAAARRTLRTPAVEAAAV